MTPDMITAWMLSRLQAEGCIYQDDVVDRLVKENSEDLLIENADGNLVVGKAVLKAFLGLTAETVVWVRPDRYWRWRVAEDEPGRNARG